MIKEVKLSNMDMSGYYPYFSKWLASQFQIIKDRNLKDAYTDKPIWTKIYPQQDGIPIYNKSGRYWVKLYYMGREKKIEIDRGNLVDDHIKGPVEIEIFMYGR